MRALCLLPLFLLAAPAAAVPTKGNSFKAALPGTTAAKEPALAGTVVGDVLMPFSTSGPAPATGTVQVRTVKGKAGTLTFYWKINVAAASKGKVRSLVLRDFYGQYDVNWRQDGLGTVAPTAISAYFADKHQFHVFEFPAPLAAGQSSRFLFFRSTSTASMAGEGRVEPAGDGIGVPFKIQIPAN